MTPSGATKALPPLLGTLRTLMRFWLRHRFQAGLCLLGVAAGVAVFTAIELANRGALSAFADSMAALTGRATHQVRAEGGGDLDEALVPLLARQPQVRAAAPMLRARFRVPLPAPAGAPASGAGPTFTLDVWGIDLVGDAQLRALAFVQAPPQAPAGDASTGSESLERLLTRGDGLLLPAPLARRLGVAEGSVLAGEGPAGPVRLTVLGVFEPPPEKRAALHRTGIMDLAAHQEQFGGLGRVDTIALILAKGGEAAVRDLLPPGARLEPAGSALQRITRMSDAFRLNLRALALFALLVAAFLIFNAASFAVVQRASTVAILRCLGATSGTVLAALALESLLLGLLGAGGGLALGTWWGELMLRNTGATLFEVILNTDPMPAAVRLDGGMVWRALALGMGVALAGAAWPAWQTARISPLAAVRGSKIPAAGRGVGGIMGGKGAGGPVSALALLTGAGVLTLALGAGLLLWPSQSLGAALMGALALALGGACLTPGLLVLAGRFGAPLLGRLAGSPGRLAARNLVRALPRTGLAAAALMVALALALAVEITVRSFRHTFTLWLEQAVTADLYLEPEAEVGRVLAPEFIAALRTLDGVADVAVLRSRRVLLRGREVIVLGLDMPAFGRHARLPSRDGAPEEVFGRMTGGAALLSESLAYPLGLARGDPLALPTPDGMRDFTVGAVVQNYSAPQGVVYLDDDTYQRTFGPEQPAHAALWLKPGADSGRVAEALAALPGAGALRLTPNAALRGEALRVFNRTFVITDVMGALAAGVAFIAVISALAALLEERTRILGVLRAIGVTRAQLALSMALEAGLLAASATLMSWVVGPATAAAVVFVINRRAFGWTLQYLPWAGNYAGLLALALAAAWLGSAYPIWRATRLSAAATIREE